MKETNREEEGDTGTCCAVYVKKSHSTLKEWFTPKSSFSFSV